MRDTFISFYLRANRVHVFVDALRGIGSPKFICFFLQEDGRTFAITPYKKKDFRSHRIPHDVYEGTNGMEVSSKKLCQIISRMHHWVPDCSYRVPGFVLDDHSAAIFDLSQAEIIENQK